jgi:hypothetical protein
MENLVNEEVSQQEITNWLDFKRVKPSSRENYKGAIDELANAITEGYLSLDENFNLTLKLIFPITNEISTTELVFKPRVKIGEIQKAMQGTKSDDAQGMILAIVSCLTNKPKQLIKELDVEDYGICQNIALFFIPK